MNSFWNQIIFGNTVLSWVIAISIAVVALAAIRICKSIILKRIKAWAVKTSNKLDDFFILLAEKTVFPVLYIGAIYSGLNYLTISIKVTKIIHVAVLLVCTFFVIRAITSVINYFVNNAITAKDGEGEKKKRIVKQIRSVVWQVGINN